MRETDWYPGLVQLAHQFGWRVNHARAAAGRSGKWSTPIMGHPGYPDFTFAHPSGVVLFREIKGPRTTVTPDQQIWLDQFTTAGLDAGVWRMPADWPLAVETLSFGRAAAGDMRVDDEGIHVQVVRQTKGWSM